MRHKLIAGGIAALALMANSFAAQAADIPRPVYKGGYSVSYYNWTGFYAGLNAGYGFGRSAWDNAGVSGPVAVSPRGWLAGLTAGYNYQTGAIVWGLEGDIAYSAVRASTPCGAFSCETSNRWLSTVRGRVGYAVDRFLPYLTAGVAYGDVRAVSTDPVFPGASKTKLGWTAGAGLEYAFMGNWSAKLEYLYVDLGRFDCGTACSPIVPDNVSFKEHVVRIGLNYKFGGR